MSSRAVSSISEGSHANSETSGRLVSVKPWPGGDGGACSRRRWCGVWAATGGQSWATCPKRLDLGHISRHPRASALTLSFSVLLGKVRPVILSIPERRREHRVR